MSGIVALVVVVAVYFAVTSFRSSTAVNTLKVNRADIVQDVSLTGNVRSASNVDLAFEKAGRVAAIYADVGTRVTVGKTLVVLDSADLYADLTQAQAQLARDQIKLADMKAGTRPEDIAIAQNAVDNANTALNQTSQSVVSTLQDAYSKIDDAIRYHTDKFFTNPRTINPQLVFQISDSSLASALQQERVGFEAHLNIWKDQLTKLSPTDDLSSSFVEADLNLNNIKNFIDKLSLAVNSLTASGDFPQTTIDGYKADMSAARLDVSTAVTEANSIEQSFKSAQSALSAAQSQLNLKKAGYTAADIGAAQAQVAQDQGLIDAKRAAIAKNVIVAPISGIVSRQDAKVGQIAPVGTTLVSVLSDSQFQIEANVPEANIAKIAVGNPAKVTLDAYGSDTFFNASVIKIDPAEIVIDGVPTYKVTLQFAAVDPRIRSGMTANLTIVTATKANAITIPERLVTTDATTGTTTVQVKDGNSVVTKTIVTGLVGSHGDIEVVSGLAEGDLVVDSSK